MEDLVLVIVLVAMISLLAWWFMIGSRAGRGTPFDGDSDDGDGSEEDTGSPEREEKEDD